MTYEQEKKQALELINAAAFVSFVYEFADETVGLDRVGAPTTVRAEIGECARLAHKAYIDDGVSYYRSYSAFRSVEYSDEDMARRSSRLYFAAGKKLLFLSSAANRLAGRGFINRRIDKSDLTDITMLVDSFEWCVRHYDEVVKAASLAA